MSDLPALFDAYDAGVPGRGLRFWLAASKTATSDDVAAIFRLAGWEQMPHGPLSTMGRAHLVVGVIGEAGRNASAFVELGFGLGKRRPVVVFVEAQSEELPDELRPFLSTQPIGTAPEAAVDVALAVRPLQRDAVSAPSDFVTTDGGLGPASDELVRRFRESRTEQDLQAVFADALELSSNASVVAQPRDEPRFDFGIWEASLPARWNPVVVEVKRSMRSWNDVLAAGAQLDEYLAVSTAPLGLLLLGSGDSRVRPGELPTSRHVVVYDGLDLLGRWRWRPLGVVLLEPLGTSATLNG